MALYIEHNHEANSSFCHFGIHRKSNDELIGYVDFQNIDPNLESAELSLSIPDKKYRNKHYGIDATLSAMQYGIFIRKIKNIIFRTRIDNSNVRNICEKFGMRYEIEHFSGNGYDIDLIVYTINKDVFIEIAHKLAEKE